METYKTPQELIFGSLKNPEFKNRVCLEDVSTGKRLTYSDLDRETALAAGLFKRFGIRAGDTISLLLENGLHFFAPWLGAMRMGAVAHPVNCLYTTEQIIYAMELCESKALILQERYVWDSATGTISEMLREIGERFPYLPIFILHDPLKFKLFESIPFADQGEEKGARFLRNSYSWSRILSFIEPYNNVAHKDTDDAFQLICTSGTTGKPKAVVQHCAMFEPNVRDIIEAYRLSENDRTLLINRLFHVNAQVTNFYAMILLGGSIVLAQPNPATFLETITKYEITYSSVVPSTLKEVLKYPLPKKASLEKLRFLITGADILSQELHRKFSWETGITVRPGWGMTETLCWGSATPVGEPVIYGSIGTPLNHTEFKIVDPENNWEEVRQGKPGRLIVKGKNVFKKYFKNPDATKKAFLPSERWGESWMDAGDTCYQDKRKTFHFAGRPSVDSWKVRGEFVSGPEIDEYLKTHPEVDDAMAVPIILEGETETFLFVVLKSEVEEKDEMAKKIADYAETGRKQGKMAKHYKIKGIAFVKSIALGDTGKKSRKKMTELAAEFLNKITH